MENKKEIIIAGAGIGALAIAAYFFTGAKGKRNQRKFKGWMIRMKGEVIDRLEDIQDVTEPVYNEVVDTVAQAQLVSERIPREEIMQLAEELKRDWRTITRLAKGKRPTRARPKAKSKKTSRKTSSKRRATSR
jgi:hypothetical protein